MLLAIWMLLPAMVLPAFAQTSVTLQNQDVVSLQRVGQLYTAPGDQATLPVPEAMDDLPAFLSTLHPVATIDRLAGGRYWYYLEVENHSAQRRWVFNPYDTVADTFELSLFSPAGMGIVKARSGLIEKGRFQNYYGLGIELPVQQRVGLLVYMDSRYYSGMPRFELITEQRYIDKITLHLSIVMACLGALFVLAIYNLFVGSWTRDRSYIYYAAYLAASIIAWAGAFNLLSQWFTIHSTQSLIVPFYVLMFFSVLYYIHFLDLPAHRPLLGHLSYALAALCLLMAVMPGFFTPGRYMFLHSLLSVVWVSLALFCGAVRLRDGYKPARFFVLAFTLVALGGLPSILSTLGLATQIKNHYLITLVFQTFDMAVLALALADRINILRSQREEALRRAIDTEHRSTITEREANLKLQEALEISEQENEKKSQFLQMVSHELRTPLHSIISATEQWEDHADNYAKKDLFQYVAYGVARLRTQIDNLVVFAETEADDLTPNIQLFELRPLMDRLIDRAQVLVAEGVELVVELDPGLPVAYEGDNYLLEHLVRSVLENACKYTVHGRVNVSLSWDDEASKLVVLVTDSGCGMSREQLRLVFNDFVQVSRGMDRDSEGMGLGLTICYRLSDILSADFEIKSDLGVGTEVSIQIPLNAKQRGLRVVETSTPASQPNATVLLVEDNDVNAAVLGRLVGLLGYQVERARSGQEAVQMVTGEHYHLILMDIQMPIMDGITATRWIRQRGIKTPIIGVSANSDMAVRRRCREVGMGDFLVKPVARSDIERVLDRILESRDEL